MGTEKDNVQIALGGYVSADKGKSPLLHLAKRRLLGHWGILDLDVPAQTSEAWKEPRTGQSQAPNIELREQPATSTMYSGTWLAFSNFRFYN